MTALRGNIKLRPRPLATLLHLRLDVSNLANRSPMYWCIPEFLEGLVFFLRLL